MKKTIFTRIATVLFFCLSGFAAQAQLSVGGGLVYHTELSELGINLRAQFDVADLGDARLGVVPSVTYYLMGEGLSWMEFSADANLRFGDTDGFMAYPLVGFRYDLITVSFLGTSVSSGEFGYSAGAGAQYNLGGSAIIYVEGKYQGYFSEFGGTPIGVHAGVLIPIGN